MWATVEIKGSESSSIMSWMTVITTRLTYESEAGVTPLIQL